MSKRLVIALTVLSLSVFPACSAIDSAIAKMTAKMDELKASITAEARQAMDRLEIAMQDAVKTFIEKGKEAAGEKINDVVTLLVALSGQVKGQLQDVIGGSIAKAIGGDKGLLDQVKKMAAENPEALQALGDQFVNTIVDSTQKRLSEGGAGSSLLGGITSSISSSIKEAVSDTASQVIGAIDKNGGGGSFNLDPASLGNGGDSLQDSTNPNSNSGGGTVRVNPAGSVGGNSLDDDFFTRRVTMDDNVHPVGRGFVVSPSNPDILIPRSRQEP